MVINKNTNINDINIDIKLPFDNLEKKYNLKQQQFKEEIEREYIRITNDMNDMNDMNSINQNLNINNLKIS